MALDKKQKMIVFVVALVLLIGASVAIALLVKKHKKNHGGKSSGGDEPSWTVATRQWRIAHRLPFDSYNNHTTTSDLTTMASAYEARLQKKLPSGTNLRVYPGGVEEIHWAAAQRKSMGFSVAVASPPASSSCQALPATDAAGGVNSDYTISLTPGGTVWGSLVIESDADASTVNAAIDAINDDANAGGSVNSNKDTPWVATSTVLPTAPTHTDAVSSCSTALPVSASS